MIIVTGGAGFIGSNLVAALNARDDSDVLIVDRLTNEKLANISDLHFSDFMSVDAFRAAVTGAAVSSFGANRVEAVYHQGACSDTMVTDGGYVLDNNYNCSKEILHWCLQNRIPLVYASSASVYGAGSVFKESAGAEHPLNIYAASKWMFDQYVRKHVAFDTDHVVGLRYFNVYGPRESHKQRMASVAWHFSNQYRAGAKVRLFEGTDGYADGEQRRDFVHVDDVAKVNLWAAGEAARTGIYNVGTGRSRTFNDMAASVINAWCAGKGAAPMTTAELVATKSIEYAPFPDNLRGKYQSFTQADVTHLRDGGYTEPFVDLDIGVSRYVDKLKAAYERE